MSCRRTSFFEICIRSAALASLVSCRAGETSNTADLAILGESTRIRLESSWPATTAWFDGSSVSLVAARGEILGLQVLHREQGSVSLIVHDEPSVVVRGYNVESFAVDKPSTAMYGGSQGRGTYADGLTPVDRPTTNPAYFEIEVAPTAEPRPREGVLLVGSRRIPVMLEISGVTLPTLPISAWAYEDPREIAWASGSSLDDPPRAKPSPAELQCIALFRSYGVLLSPDIHLDWWPERRHLFAGIRDVPAWIPAEPAAAAQAVRGWIDATRGTGQVPFAVPIDEPRTHAKQRNVRAVAAAVRVAGGGPSTFRYAVTDEYRPEYEGLIDLYIPLYARRDDRFPRWTYNGAPPHAGSMVLDAQTPGTRTWGWIAWRWQIATWYIWDALYWHDRHNRNGRPLPGKRLVPSQDTVSFHDGEDYGNFDGVLALPIREGCRPTLRLAAIRRGFLDKELLEMASRCAPAEVAALAADVVPRALGDAPKRTKQSWSSDESDWERARRALLRLAACNSSRRAGSMFRSRNDRSR